MSLPLYRVTASSISEITISFVCPFCYTKYKKDKTPCANAKHKIHSHGNNGRDMSNRDDECRVPHCDKGRFPEDQYNMFEIVIDDTTVRK